MLDFRLELFILVKWSPVLDHSFILMHDVNDKINGRERKR